MENQVGSINFDAPDYHCEEEEEEDEDDNNDNELKQLISQGGLDTDGLLDESESCGDDESDESSENCEETPHSHSNSPESMPLQQILQQQHFQMQKMHHMYQLEQHQQQEIANENNTAIANNSQENVYETNNEQHQTMNSSLNATSSSNNGPGVNNSANTPAHQILQNNKNYL